MRNSKAFVLFALFSFIASFTFGQKITGEVYDKSTQQPIVGASVIAGTSSQGTTTDAAGKFAIETGGAKVLHISFVGYSPVAVTITNTLNYSIGMDAVNTSLDQVVVVGYGTQKKANLTGAVASVDVTKTFGSKPMNDPTKALQGIVPGLTILYGNGGLTAGADIKIRGIGSINGTSKPLILVDNVPTDDLSIINPQDIESVSVLKDAASSSIYGARAAFGVVLIKTKSGRKNQRSSITYSNNFSWNKPTILPDFADPVDELQALNDAGVRNKTSQPETFGMVLTKLRDGIINWKQNYAGKNGHEMVKGEDWDIVDGRAYFYKVWDPKKEMLYDYTFSQQHNVSIQGGSDKISYYLSGGFSSDGGIMKMNPDNVKKYNITAGINASVTPWLDVSAKTLYRNFRYEYPFQYQTYWYYFWRWGAYFPYGTYQGKYFRVNSAYMDAAQKASLVDNYSRVDLGATFKLTKNLSIRADYTIGRDNAIRHESGGAVTAWDFWSAGVPQLANIATTSSSDQITYTEGRYAVNTFNAYATYQNTFAKSHNLKVIAGVNTEDDENFNFFAARKGILDPSQGELGLSYADQLSGIGSVLNGWSPNGHGKKAFGGYFGRINYDYAGKYLFELNTRYDGSSFFPAQDRWALFTSASAGYRISEENFFQNLKPAISDLKIRASYGELGNQDVSANGANIYLKIMNGSQTNWLTSSGTYAQTITQPLSIANSLKWERVSTLDFGTDLRVLDNHIGVSVDYYERNTKGMIQSTSVPSTFGTGGPKVNAGNFRTRGYEITVDANYSIGRDVQLYGSLGFADSRTVFTKWDNPNNSISTAFNYVGKTYGEIWGFQTQGFFSPADTAGGTFKPGIASQKNLQSGNFVYGPGDIRYANLNGDSVISGGKMTLADHGDLKVIGNTQPRYQYNARIGGSWKNIDVDIFIQGVGKREWWGVGNIVLPMYQSLDILYANQLDYWTPTHQNAKFPVPFPNNGSGTVGGLMSGGNNFYPQTKYLLNLAYCRLKNVTLGYSLPERLLSRYSIQKLRVYLSGENLAEISNVGAPIDPEITDGETSSMGRTFPFLRSYSFGIQLTF